ncbi:Uncharacterized protein TCM_027705 [Theobroma cacao]|uniref:RNase H type-1 domain-containing protein n=1 Tax=Theobroma cacao TaxID=3641 RepID=A0A061GA17_THECC|nr:Uncharacterized protein TCM_027705 [Theobroma cacao]
MRGMLKFNVDKDAKGNPRESGIGDAFKDDEGKMLSQCSLFVGVLDANTTKILTIKKAFQIIVAFRWGIVDKVIMENDSENVVKWAKEPSTTFWKLRTTMMRMEFFKSKLKDWSFFENFKICKWCCKFLG